LDAKATARVKRAAQTTTVTCPSTDCYTKVIGYCGKGGIKKVNGRNKRDATAAQGRVAHFSGGVRLDR